MIARTRTPAGARLASWGALIAAGAIVCAACAGSGSQAPGAASSGPEAEASSPNAPATPADANAAAPGGAAPADANVPSFSDTINQVEVTLYFVRADGEALWPEKRRIFRTASVNDRARQVVQALIDGPEGDLLPSMPPGTQLQEIFVAADGTAYVDFGSEILSGLSTGTIDAVYTIYSIVDTLAQDFSEIQRVKILVNGDEAGDVGGHFDLSRPILPEMSLVHRRAGGSRK